MSMESAQTYIERLRCDEDFAKRIEEAESSESRELIVRSEGFSFTKHEIDKVASKLSEEELAALLRGPSSGTACECNREGELGCR